MALNLDFYEEIIKREKTWLTNLEYNLLNVYYLPELRNFYADKQDKLNIEVELTGNTLINSISNVIQNMILKLDNFIDQNQKGNDVNLQELKKFFLLSALNNDFYVIKKENTIDSRLEKIINRKSDLYDLKKMVIREDLEDYLDDDFYYNGKKSA